MYVGHLSSRPVPFSYDLVSPASRDLASEPLESELAVQVEYDMDEQGKRDGDVSHDPLV